MRLLRYIFSARPTVTPIKSVRRKVLLAGEVYSVHIEAGARNSMRREGSTLVFTLREMTAENFENYFSSWYRRQARKMFEASIAMWRVRMERMGYFTPDVGIKIYNMRRAWGRCYYTKDVITLNLNLAKTPPRCVDCITLHELCHFLIHSHSADFYAIMSRIEPDWEIWEMELKSFARSHRVIQ